MRAKFVPPILGIALCCGGASQADEAVPLVPALSPTQPPEIVTRFHKALAEGMKAGGLTPMSIDEVRASLKLPPDSVGCGGGACVAAAVVTLGHSRRYAAATVALEGKNYQIDVRVFHGRAAVAQATGNCDICTLSEALRVTSKVSAEATTKALAAPTQLRATTPKPPEPKPAPKLEPKPKPKPEVSSVTKPPAPKEPPPDVVTPPPAPSRTSWPLWPALVSLGVGVAGLATGIPLLAIDGDPTNCVGAPRPDARNCADLYNTAGGGWALTGVGITALAASGVFFYLHFSRGAPERSTRVSLQPLEGGMGIRASGSF